MYFRINYICRSSLSCGNAFINASINKCNTYKYISFLIAAGTVITLFYRKTSINIYT